MKIVYLYSRMEKNFEASGEAKKAMMQVNGLKSLGADADIYIHDQCIPLYKIRIRLPFYSAYRRRFRKEFIDYLKNNNIDAVYIRKHLIDKSLISFIKELKQTGIIVVYEIPTYPYDMEWSQLQDWPLLYKEKYYRKKIRGIDRIVTYSSDNEIFGIKCINTSNGIEPEKIPIRKHEKCNNNNIVNLLGVATLERWHGYDRLIKGLSEYYISNKENARKIEFHIVGEGAEYKNLRKLTDDLKMNDHVFFHGFMHGDELTKMFDEADIGVGSLGMYRIGLYEGYTLKLREYMARGLPFIYAYDDALIESTGCDYSYKFSNDNEVISIDKVIQFHDGLSNEKDIEMKMHDIAEKHLSWKSQMQPIYEYVKERVEK